MQNAVVAFTDEDTLPVNIVQNVLRELGNEGVEECDPKIITQVSSISKSLSSCLGSFLFLFCVIHDYCHVVFFIHCM